jgi:transposase
MKQTESVRRSLPSMQSKYDTRQENAQELQLVSQELAHQLELFLLPLVIVLDTLLDKRLVLTFQQCCVALLRFRNCKHGLLLSELGLYLDGVRGLSPAAPAGTKRLGNLIRAVNWTVTAIDQFLLNEADKEGKRLKEQGKRVLCLWDGSVLEKPESRAIEGLCPVTSSKAKRLKRSRKGRVFNMPAARPSMVTGMQWTGAFIAGMEGPIKVALMSWWTTKGDYATKLRQQEEELLRICVRKWGNTLIHVFARGYSSGPWICLLESLRVRFVIRWKKVWYLVTNERVVTAEHAWDLVFTYRRRWQIETSFRKALVQCTIHLKCHRTGKRCKNILAPLYRLRWAMSRLWDDARPLLKSLSPPPREALRAFAFLSG